MDLFDYGPSYLWYLGYGAGVAAVYVFMIAYGWPFLQAIIQYQNKIWLNNVLAQTKGLSEENQAAIRKSAEPESDNPLYKFTKFTYLISGVIMVIAGLLVIMLQEADKDVAKNIIYIPLLLGAGSIYYYKNNQPNSKLWKETAGFFGIAGVCITIPGIFGIYEWDWMRSDILIYIVLALALGVVHFLESTVASYMYMLAVAAGSFMLWLNVEAGWLAFAKSFMWFFALAPLVFWMPKLKSARENGPKEIAFGILFFFMMIAVTVSNLKALAPIALVILLPIMYMFSKIHFKQSGWFVTKPIQTLMVLATFGGLYAICSTPFLEAFPSFASQFEDFYFYKLIDYFVVIAMGFGAVMMFRDNFEEDMDKINLVVLGLPVAAYVCSFLADYYISYLFIPVMGYFGWIYLDNGLKGKNVFSVLLGMAAITSVIPILYSKFEPSTQVDPNMIGIMLILYGSAFVAATLYLKGRWSVSDEDDVEIKKVAPASNDVLDSDMNNEV